MRVRILLLSLVALAATLTGARADTPYPVLGEPVLRPDTAWEATSWGYKLNAFTFDVSRDWPTIFTMEGYDGASRPSPNVYLRMDDGKLMALRITYGAGPTNAYASVQASTRGTECSEGHFNLYDRRHAWDGHHIIEWIAAQSWSNGNVGMFGSSFPGQTAYWVAATQPPHLKAVSANLLHSDIYRDIFMPGGIQNYLFPTLWTYAAGPHRLPTGSLEEGTIPADEICTQHQLARYQAGDLPQPENEPAWAAVRSVDDQWYVAHAALTYAPAITIPYYQQVNWQDEQVGSRAVVLFNHIHPKKIEIRDANGDEKEVIPKKFVLSNGNHGYGNFAGRDRWTMFDIILRGMPDTTGFFDDQVVNYFETDDDGNAVGKKSGDTWPFKNTRWERMYARAGHGLSSTPPTTVEPGDDYLSGIGRQGFLGYSYETDALPPDLGSDVHGAQGLPDGVHYLSEPFTSQTVVAGPMSIDLYASMIGTDADFFVSVSDVFPDGKVSYLTRGMLKASHRAIDPLRSYYAEDQNGDDIMVQPYRPHTGPQMVMPGEVNKYTIEIFPLGYVFRKDHKLLVQVTTPPVFDGIWGYTPSHQPAVVSIAHDAAHPTSILLPVVTPDEEITADTTPCPQPGGFPCVPASALSLEP
jgi:uncharacterized protein